MTQDLATKIEVQPKALPPAAPEPLVLKQVKISGRTRFVIRLMKMILRPWLAWVLRGSLARIARFQLLVASRECKDTSGLPLDYCVLGKVPGHLLGNAADNHKNAVLYLHGGAFILPAVPESHAFLLGRLCRDLDAVGFLADYRLAPVSKFPAALDDCEQAYRALLDLGFQASRIVIAGESAGGNLTLGLLQRIRRNGLPMPACAIPISAGAEMGRLHSPPARLRRMKQDPLLGLASLARVAELYVGEWDSADPELSPLLADFRGLPPLFFLVSDNEVLLDDSVLMARRAREAGVKTRLDVWPVLPHAFPLFERLIPEARQARLDMVAFAREHLPQA
jgi:epsilon-lactone hydrolase